MSGFQCGDCGNYRYSGWHIAGGYYQCTECSHKDRERQEDIQLIKQRNKLLAEQNELIRQQLALTK